MPATLRRHRHPAVQGPVAVIVLDGVGIGRHDEGDAVFLARTPVMDRLDHTALRTSVLAHGTHVGMPSDGDMGNSEVGHNALGAGRIYDQGAKLVDVVVRDGRLFDRDSDASNTWCELVDTVRANGSTLHLIGLLSDGNVHSHIEHVDALVRDARDKGVGRLRLHVLLDGRDVSGQSALVYVDRIEALLAEMNTAGADYRIASGGGRMLVTMDRYEAEWSMVELGWKLHVRGEGTQWPSAKAAIEAARAADPSLNDQYIPPFVVAEDGQPVGPVGDGDAVLLFNFRGDRAIELSRAFDDPAFDAFERGPRPNCVFAGMMQYDGDLGIPRRFLVPPPAIKGTMGERLADAGVKQLAISETHKYGHVTYFWNGNRTEPFDPALETYVEYGSDLVVCDERPWMKAAEITDGVLSALRADPEIRFARVNYPNGDMVGHTGNREATIIAVEASDLSLGRLLAAIESMGGAAIVTADHGNADEMFQLDPKTGEFARDAHGRTVPMTAHTLNPVPLWVFAPGLGGAIRLRELQLRRLSNVAATALLLLGFEAPDDMDPPLIEFVEP